MSGISEQTVNAAEVKTIEIGKYIKKYFKTHEK